MEPIQPLSPAMEEAADSVAPLPVAAPTAAASLDNAVNNAAETAQVATHSDDYTADLNDTKHNMNEDGTAAVPEAASAAKAAEKANWHSRKISWGMDTVLGVGDSGAAGLNAINTASNNSPNPIINPTTSNLNNPTTSSLKRSPMPTTTIAAAAAAAPIMNGTAGSGRPSPAIKRDDGTPVPDTPDVNAKQAAYIYNLFAGAPPPKDRQRHVSSLGNVDLADILKESPMETEANTYILKAIEEREAQVSETVGTFSNISDDAISAMSAADSVASAEPDANNSHNTSQNTGSNIDNSSSAARTPNSAAFSPRGRYNHSNHHRRKPTMEQQLSGLASAIDAFTQQAESSPNLAGNLPTWEEEYNPTSNMSSAENLQRNASMLYHRGKRGSMRDLFQRGKSMAKVNLADEIDTRDDSKHKVETEQSTTPKSTLSLEEDYSTSSSKRRQSLRNLMHPKKTDGDDNNIGANHAGPSSIHDNTSAGGNSQMDDIEEGAAEDQTNRDSESVQQKSNAVRNKKRKEWQAVRELHDFFEPQKATIAIYLRVAFLYIAGPLLGIACILFYVADCPPTGRLANGGAVVNGTLWNTKGEPVDPQQASIAFILVFVVRQIVTFTLAKASEKVFVDYLTIRSRGTVNFLGPWLTLFILQSKGWPSTTVLWAIFNFCFLYGSSAYVQHWMYWQDMVGLFNAENPGGVLLSSEWNLRILLIALVLGIAVSMKRLVLGLYLGKRTFVAYADQLASVMHNIVMISEVAALARAFEREMKMRANQKGVSNSNYVAHMSAEKDKLFDIFDDLDDDAVSAGGGRSTDARSTNSTMADKSEARRNVTQIIDPDDRNPWSGSLTYTQQQRIIQLLGAWEEPVVAEKTVEFISVSALLQFRRSMACLNTPFYFSGPFGLADTREHCIQSAQELYWRLLLNTPDQPELNFETLALLGLKDDDTLDQDKLKEMIRIFRPDREGNLGLLDFVKSIDTVYKEIRLLRASVTNASKIDKSFETILNWLFYGIAGTIILGQLGYSPMAIFLSISGVILAFAFMIGSASSTYFEGLLFILVRQPYAIGDGIHVMGVESEGMYSGHAFWYVEDVSLFTTSVMFMFTGERATLSNGSLANSRIVNSSRSPQAWMYITLKFPVNVTHEKLQVFNGALEQFFKNRPREWKSYDSFRAMRLDAQAGFIEYMVACTHRESWYEWVSIHVSKAEVIHFCMELSKQLGISYRTPNVPVDLTIQDSQTQALFAPNLLGEARAGPPAGHENLGSQFPLPQMGGQMPMAPLRQGPEQPDLSDLQSMFPPRKR